MVIDGISCLFDNQQPGGYIWQPNRRPPILRLRNRHRRFSVPPIYLGYSVRDRPGYPIWDYNIHKLAAMAHYWDTSLTGTQQAAWASVGNYPTGFESFMFQNLCGYDESPGPSLPYLGQNIADSVSNGPDLAPCMPLVPTSYPSGPTPSFTLSFVVTDELNMSSVTATHTLSSFVSWYTMYSSRPYSGTRNVNHNPMIRMGLCINHTFNNSMKFVTDFSTGAETDLAECWNRVIGGGRPGQKIDYGGRRMRLNLHSKPSAASLHTATLS